MHRNKNAKNHSQSLEKIIKTVYFIENTGSVLRFPCGIIPPPALKTAAPGDDDKLSLCGVTMLPTDSGRERMVAHFFVSSKNGRYEKRETKVAESKDF